jgi:hypothetical protein
MPEIETNRILIWIFWMTTPWRWPGRIKGLIRFYRFDLWLNADFSCFTESQSPHRASPFKGGLIAASTL